MARRSRKELDTTDTAIVHMDIATQSNIKIFKTAIYARLSAEDSGKKDSDTIENQIHLVKQYISERPYLQLTAVFSDNGETGTKFDRPQFNKMMDAVRRSDIDCIVVKDLSRFGRNYIETGNHLEKIFPFMGTRFISVNDGYDNQDPNSSYDNLSISLKSLINDVYAKDTSRKVKAALEAKQRKGEYLGAYAAYGYLRSDIDDSKLVVNNETAPTVRDIFRWKLEGESYTSIARKLNDIGILSPGRYLYQNCMVRHDKYSKSIWKPETVKGILMNPVYMGYMSQGKRKSRLLLGLPSTAKKSDEWINIPDMHEAIVDKETFEAVADMLASITANYHQKAHRSSDKGIATHEKSKNIFIGILRCADCGAKMKRRKRILAGGKIIYHYLCAEYLVNHTRVCKCSKYIREEKLIDVVWGRIKIEIALCVDVVRVVNRIQNSTAAKSKATSIKEQISSVQKKIKRLDSLLSGLYGDYSENILTESEYIFTKAKHKEEKGLLQLQLDELHAEIEKLSDGYISGNEWASAMTKFKGEQSLSREILLSLVDNITVAEGNLITITFKHKDEYAALMGYMDELKSFESEVLHYAQ